MKKGWNKPLDCERVDFHYCGVLLSETVIADVLDMLAHFHSFKTPEELRSVVRNLVSTHIGKCPISAVAGGEGPALLDGPPRSE